MTNYWNNYAEETARQLKSENPDWDEESLIYETMEAVEFELMEELSFIERHLREFLKENVTDESKKLSNENE